MLKPRRSRRVRALRDSDYDHEITLVDHDGPRHDAPAAEGGALATTFTTTTTQEASPGQSHFSTDTTDTTTRLLRGRSPGAESAGNSVARPARAASSTSPSASGARGSADAVTGSGEGLGIQGNGQDSREDLGGASGSRSASRQARSTSHDEPLPEGEHQRESRSGSSSASQPASRPQTRHSDSPSLAAAARPPSSCLPPTAFDILYENERGGFLCGAALFSPRALGNLDPAPWTNKYHRKSRTDTRTAQPPDPEWQWAWPEWRLNRGPHADDAGWEYSFAFARRFGWHGPRWYNSFVRRRVWVRKRERVGGDASHAGYFDVRPASRGGLEAGPESAADRTDICGVETLLAVVRTSRIDREKIEAVESYVENAADLGRLGAHMHEIMGQFVYQTSRRLLLAWLTERLEGEQEGQGEGEEEEEGQGGEGSQAQSGSRSAAQGKRPEHPLAEAVRRADDEVKKLAYWSDVKRMAENGHSGGPVEERRGWDDGEWEGVDRSGAAEPRGGELPGGETGGERPGEGAVVADDGGGGEGGGDGTRQQ